MTACSQDILISFLEEVDSSNLTPRCKLIARQLTTDVVRLANEVKTVNAELAKQRELSVNIATNKPSSKKAEWEKGNNSDSESGKKKKGIRQSQTPHYIRYIPELSY